MGCDIHCIIEYKHKTVHGERWDSFGFSEISPCRDYEWFADLAGVRGDPKGERPFATGFGLPNDISFATQMATTINVSEDNEEGQYHSVKRSNADKWVAEGYCKIVPGYTRTIDGKDVPYRITHPDFHTYGWCNLKDWKKSTRGKKGINIKAMTAVLDSYKKNGCDVRVIFWFDN